MKIIQINSECGRGSTGKIAVSISKVLNDSGIENYIFYSSNHKSNYPNSIRIGTKLGLRIHQVLSRLFGDQGLHSTLSTILLINKIKRMNPDVIHLHNIHGYYLNFKVFFKYLSTYKGCVFWTLHDCWPFTGHCTHFLLNGCDRWKEGCYHCPSKKQYPYSLLFDRSKKMYRIKKKYFTAIDNLTIITPSLWLASIVQKSFLNVYKIKVINNGIDLGVFKPRSSSFREKNNLTKKFIVLGVASSWSNKKGLDVFLNLSRCLNDSFAVVLVGIDEKQKKIIEGNIIAISRTTNQEQLAQLYSCADVFLNPTREDNFPTVNIESLACGTPVLTFDTGGSAEIINERTGEIVPDDVQFIAKRLQYHKDSYKFTTEECVKKAKEFDEKVKFLDYVKCYFEK